MQSSSLQLSTVLVGTPPTELSRLLEHGTLLSNGAAEICSDILSKR